MEGKLTYRQTRPLVMVTEWELVKVMGRMGLLEPPEKQWREEGLWKLGIVSLKESMGSSRKSQMMAGSVDPGDASDSIRPYQHNFFSFGLISCTLGAAPTSAAFCLYRNIG